MVEFQEWQENMEQIDLNNTVINIEKAVQNSNDSTLQEERRRTGKALATGIVIFLICLGLYHYFVFGSSKLSALVGGLIIMLLYVISLLYSSHRRKQLSKFNEAALEREIKEVIVNASKSAKTGFHEPQENEIAKNEDEKSEPPDRPLFVRTYSVG